MTIIKSIKLIVVVLLGYPLLYAEIYGEIPFLLKGSYLLLDLCLILLVIMEKKGKLRLPIEIWLYVAFFLVSLVSGLIMASYYSYFLERIFMGIQYLMLAIAVYEICIRDGNIKYISIVLYCISIVYLTVALSSGNYVFGRLVVSEGANANSLGMMCFATAGIGTYLSMNLKRTKLLLAIGSIVFSGYIAMLSGSRKYLLIIIAFTVLFYLPLYRDVLKKNIGKAMIWAFLLIAIAFAVTPYISNLYETSIISSRFQNAETIDEGRWELYADAWNVFKRHPLFGVGYQQFQFYSSSGLYSHSAYAEVLSCTGIVGFALWLSIYIVLLKKTLLFFKKEKNASNVFALSWLLCQIALDFFSTSLYAPHNLAMIAAIIALQYLQSDGYGSAMEQNGSAKYCRVKRRF